MMILDLLRIVAYTIISLAFVYNAIDDNQRNRRTDVVWASLATEHIAVLTLLALDLGDIVSWMDARLLLTPTTVVAALAVAWQTSQRLLERRHIFKETD